MGACVRFRGVNQGRNGREEKGDYAKVQAKENQVWVHRPGLERALLDAGNAAISYTGGSSGLGTTLYYRRGVKNMTETKAKFTPTAEDMVYGVSLLSACKGNQKAAFVLALKMLAAPALFDAAKAVLHIPEKSMLADCAYQGPPPKKWVKETAPYYEGYNKALRECQEHLLAAIRAAEPEGGAQ